MSWVIVYLDDKTYEKEGWINAKAQLPPTCRDVTVLEDDGSEVVLRARWEAITLRGTAQKLYATREELVWFKGKEEHRIVLERDFWKPKDNPRRHTDVKLGTPVDDE